MDNYKNFEIPRDENGRIIPLSDEEAFRYQFGEPIADSMNANMEESSEGRRRTVDESAKARQASVAVDYHEKLAEMDFDARVAATKECITRRGTFRDILYSLLEFCLEERSYEEIEPYVREFTEFHRNRQSERRYVTLLLRTGALEEIELDENGEVLTDEAKQQAIDEGLDPEDVDVLIYDWRVVTTEVGKSVYEEMKPSARLAALIAKDPSREEAFAQIMTYCKTPRFMGDIIEKFRGSSLMGYDEESKQVRQPAAFIDKLDKAGAVFWDGDHWSLTECGRAYLEERVSA